MHITELLTEEQFEELHLCEDCAQKYLYEPPNGKAPSKGGLVPHDELEEFGPGKQECSICGIKFVEFRNSGRLGCPHDYVEFRDELLPLLENVHGETRHAGKTPRRLPQVRQSQNELIQVRKQLQQAITREDYEEAARLRDRIRQMESS
jgi:protein arginine kinase activator